MSPGKESLLYINCTVTERDAGGCRASSKLTVQLDAAVGLGTMMAPQGLQQEKLWTV